MRLNLELPTLKLYFTLDEEFCSYLEERGVTYAAARQLSKLVVSLLRGLKKSIASTNRVYYPEFSYKEVRKQLKKLAKSFKHFNEGLINRITKSWDKKARCFIICDDYLLPRYTKTAYRSDVFRDPVKKKIGTGHNIVDTIIATKGLEMTVDFGIQPKNSTIPKTKRALTQIKQAFKQLCLAKARLTRIRVVMDGGYTNMTVIPDLKELKVKYIGTIRRNKKYKMFGQDAQVHKLFTTNPKKFKTVNETQYYYEHHTLNFTDLGRHQVFTIRRGHEKRIKFYITNDLKMTPFTFLTCLHERWWIEQGHRDLKQHCGLRQMFVWSKNSVTGITKLCNLMKNFLTVKVAEAGISLRDYPFESLIEKEFPQFEQNLLKSALETGILKDLVMT